MGLPALCSHESPLPPIILGGPPINFWLGGKQLKIRISQHRGRSFRTDQLLTSPEFSNIRNHAHENNHPIHDCNFKILDTCNSFDLRLLESIYIHKKKPSLNDQNSSTELNILTWIHVSLSHLARLTLSVNEG